MYTHNPGLEAPQNSSTLFRTLSCVHQLAPNPMQGRDISMPTEHGLMVGFVVYHSILEHSIVYDSMV